MSREKLPHSYSIKVQNLSEKPPEGGAGELTFNVTNHDEIIQLIDRVRERRILPDEEVAEFVVGLKLFGEVLLRHRHEALLAELFPHFGTFMKRLKG